MFNIVNFGAIPANVVLEDVRIRGNLAGIPDRTVFTGCENMIVRNCAFE